MGNKTVLKDGLSFDWDFGHVFKFSYSYFDHIKRAPKYKRYNFREIPICYEYEMKSLFCIKGINLIGDIILFSYL